MSQVTHQQVFKAMERWAPKQYAYDWDNVGLQVGSRKDSTTGVLVTLDVTEAVVDEAIEQKANIIIAHHPMIFSPLKSVDFDTIKGRLVKKLIEHEITVYASHTNLDIAEGGVNDLLSDAIGLKNIKPLLPTHTESLVKLVVFTPEPYAEQVVDALSKAGAGHIGNYSHCTFQSPGEGTFKPLEGTNPFIGTQDKIEHVDEIKVETIVREKDLSKVIEEMKKAHPYEEVAYDVVSLKNKGETVGLGRIGTLDETMTLAAFIELVKERYDVDHLRFIGDQAQAITKVAVLGGSGEKFIQHAIHAGADAYVTGDITFHPAQDAALEGLAIVDPGHYIEKIMKQATKDYIQAEFPKTKVFVSEINTEPFQFI